MEEQPTNNQNQEWVQVNQQGSPAAPAPDPSKGRWKKPVILALVGIVSIAMLIVFVVSLIQTFTGGDEISEEQMLSETEVAIEACQDEKNVQGCIDAIEGNLAQENGNGDYCRDLEGSELVSCVTMAALAAEDPNECAMIEEFEEDYIICHDAAHAVSLESDHEHSECAKYLNHELQEKCEEAWKRRLLQNPDCSKSQIVSDEWCEMASFVQQAQTLQDPDVCDGIADEYVMRYCLAVTEPGDRDFDGFNETNEASFGTSDTNPDSDGDGLNDGDEYFIYNTDPANPDSDGDGFTDGSEVEGGYNPNGPGILIDEDEIQ